MALAGALRPALRAVAEVAPDALKVAAHPDRGPGTEPRARALRDIARGGDAGGRAVLCVGPDRGWEEPDELEMLARHGFELLTLGPRTLRTDVALVGVVTLLHDWLGPGEAG